MDALQKYNQITERSLINAMLFVVCAGFFVVAYNNYHHFFVAPIPFRATISTIHFFIALLSWYLAKFTTYQTTGKNLFLLAMLSTSAGVIISNGIYSITIGWLFVIPLFIAATVGKIQTYVFIALNCLLAASLFFIDYYQLSPTITAINQQIDQKTLAAVHVPLMFLLMAYCLRKIISNYDVLIKNLINEIDKSSKLQRAKDAFLSNMSHELRTPLNGIYGVLQLVKGGTETEKSLLSAAKHSAEALNRIVSDILDVQKLSEGKLELAPSWYSSEDIFHDIKRLYSALASSQKIELHVSISPTLPSKLYCDEIRLGQIINNLMGNAIKFTHEGSVTLSARYHDNTLHLDVTDTGIGMDEDALSHLFDRFTQADASISKKYQGTGLGMAITKELVELMQGTINVSSELGVGTTFNVSIPLDGSNQTLQEAEKADAPIKSQDLRLLFVDDVATNALVGQALLSPHFTWVYTASSGKEALAKLANQPYDVLVTDIGMPEMSGEELHRIVKAEYPHIPVIALTGNAAESDKEKFLRAGFHGVITKPFIAEELLALIHVTVGNAEQALLS